MFEQGASKTIRRFPDKLPIGLGTTSDDLLFTYLVTDPNPEGVRRFVRRHRRLFERLRRWTVCLVFPGQPAGVETRVWCTVSEFFAEPVSLSAVEEFRWFCEMRRALEQPSAAAVHVDQHRYSRARRALATPRFYATYRAWLTEGSTVFHELLSPLLHDKLARGHVRVETQVLTHRYLIVATGGMTP